MGASWHAASCASNISPARHTLLLPAGSNTATNSIVEVAALQLATGAPLALRVRLPAGESMHPGATQATGITTEDAQQEQHPEFEQVGWTAVCRPVFARGPVPASGHRGSGGLGGRPVCSQPSPQCNAGAHSSRFVSARHSWPCIPPAPTRTSPSLIPNRSCLSPLPWAQVYRELFSLLREEVAAAGPGAYLLLIGHNVRSECGAPGACPNENLPGACINTRVAEWQTHGTGATCAELHDCVAAWPHPPRRCRLLPPPKPPHISHAAAFDLPILLRHAARATLPTLRHARFLDTLVLAKHLLRDTGGPGEPENRRLSTLFEFFTGAPPTEAHRALSDCRSNASVLEALLGRLPGLPGEAPPRRPSQRAAGFGCRLSLRGYGAPGPSPLERSSAVADPGVVKMSLPLCPCLSSPAQLSPYQSGAVPGRAGYHAPPSPPHPPPHPPSPHTQHTHTTSPQHPVPAARLAEGPFLERLHAAATMPDVNWVGWVDDIPLPGQRPAAKAARRRATRPGGETSILDSLAEAAGGLSTLDDIVAAWAAPDPVARAESGGAVALEGEREAAPPPMTPEEK